MQVMYLGFSREIRRPTTLSAVSFKVYFFIFGLYEKIMTLVRIIVGSSANTKLFI